MDEAAIDMRVFCANWNTAVCDTCTTQGRAGAGKQKGMQTNLLLATGTNTQCAQHAIKYAAKPSQAELRETANAALLLACHVRECV